MRRRRLAAVIAVTALATAACQSGPGGGGGGGGGQRVEAPDSTPAPDATEGIDEGLEDFYTQSLDWEDCGDEYQCAAATVPLDYDDPGGDTIELSLLRVPATGEQPQGSLLVNPGGPGASGVEYARSVAAEELREHYDIVGFDPRGVGESAPIDCLDDPELDEFVAADTSPDSEEEITEMQAQVEKFAAGCETRSGDVLPHVGTVDVARDLDVLRAALGDEKLNYLGKSYGTYIGALHADMFPDRVGRVVLDGAMDPTLTAKEMALGQVRGFERALTAFLDWCLDQDDCAVGDTEEEARTAIRGLLEQADEEPLPTQDENRPLTESLAFYGIILPLYLTAGEGYQPLNVALEEAFAHGDGTRLLSFADIYLERSSSGEYNTNQNEALVAVNCLDHPESGTIEDAEANVPEFEAASPIFGPSLAWGAIGCGALSEQSEDGSAPIDEIAPITAEGADPILVVGTTGDPATPYEWAQSLAEQLSSGVLLTYESTVHTAYLTGSECIDDTVNAYLVDGTVPDDGKRCSS